MSHPNTLGLVIGGMTHHTTMDLVVGEMSHYTTLDLVVGERNHQMGKNRLTDTSWVWKLRMHVNLHKPDIVNQPVWETLPILIEEQPHRPPKTPIGLKYKIIISSIYGRTRFIIEITADADLSFLIFVYAYFVRGLEAMQASSLWFVVLWYID